VHYLETHLVEDLRKHKRTGLFDESPIERAHHSNNVLTRLFVNIRNWFDRQKAIEIRTHMADVPDVQKARDCMDKLSRRKLSASSVETKETKKAESKAKKISN
jgi:hypothetical protein